MRLGPERADGWIPGSCCKHASGMSPGMTTEQADAFTFDVDYEALRLEAAIGSSAETRLGLQAEYDLHHSRSAVDLSKVKRLAAAR